MPLQTVIPSYLGKGNSRFTKKVQIQKEKASHLWGREPIKPAVGHWCNVADPAYFGTEYNGDYSFDGSGTITFRNMTLQSVQSIILALFAQIRPSLKTA